MNINLYTWYGQRELDYCPMHFILSNTPITQESKSWILEKLNGRFYLGSTIHDLFMESFPSFEDPQEALMYELTWG